MPAAADVAAYTFRCRRRLLLLLPAAHTDFVLLDVGLQLPVLPLGLAAELAQDLKRGGGYFGILFREGRG